MSLSKILSDKKYLYIAGGVGVGAVALLALRKHKEDKKPKDPNAQRESGYSGVIYALVVFGSILLFGNSRKKNNFPASEARTVISIEIGNDRSKLSFVSRLYNLKDDTKFDYRVIGTHEIDTVAPEETIARLLEHVKGLDVKEIGLTCFTPVCLDPKDPNYGCVGAGTPKLQWGNYPLLATIKKRTGCENVFIDNNTNAAAIGEYRQGEYNVKNLAYVDIGSKVDVAVIVDGKPVRGLANLGGGHIRVALDKTDEFFEGTCPSHGNCLEGLVSKSAIAKRLGLVNVADPTIPDNKKQEIWEVLANYLAQLCLDLTFLLSPEVIVLNGAILNQPELLSLIQKSFTQRLNNYIDHPKLKEVETYIRFSSLGNNAGAIGAASLCKPNN